MRESVIPHPRRSRFVILRPHYVEMCDGHGTAALLLAVFEGWTNWKLQQAEVEDVDDGIWLKLSIAQLGDDLGNAVGRDAVRGGLARLVELGLVERRDSGTTDRTIHWRFNVELVCERVLELCRDSDFADDGNPTLQRREPDAPRAHDSAEKNEGKEQQHVEPDPVQEVWGHYVTVFKAERQTLDSTRRTLIKNALKVRSVAECKRAIDGLHASPFHNGENDRQTKYLDIRFALKGNSQRGESNQERIDKMGELAPAHGLAPGLERKVAIRLDNYRRFLASGKTREARRSLESKAELEEMGFAVIDMEGPPWVRLEKAE